MEVKHLNDYRLENIMKREQDRLRTINNYWEYCLIKDWNNQQYFADAQAIQIGDVFAIFVEMDNRPVLVSIIFFFDCFELEEVLDWLDNYSLYWQECPKQSDKLSGAAEIIQGLRFGGQALILYRRGLSSLNFDASEFPEVTEIYKLTNEVEADENTKVASPDIQEKRKIYFNGEEVTEIPELEFDRGEDLVFINGLSVNIDYIEDYKSCLGIFLGQCGNSPIGWIPYNDSPVYIDLYVNESGERLCNIKFTYNVPLLNFIDFG